MFIVIGYSLIYREVLGNGVKYVLEVVWLRVRELGCLFIRFYFLLLVMEGVLFWVFYFLGIFNLLGLWGLKWGLVVWR